MDRGLGSSKSSCDDIRERAESSLDTGIGNVVLDVVDSITSGVDEVDESVVVRERCVCDALREHV